MKLLCVPCAVREGWHFFEPTLKKREPSPAVVSMPAAKQEA